MTPEEARQKARAIALPHSEALERYDLANGGTSPLADAIIAALLEAAGEWKPIDSAPRDGTRILIHTAERCEYCSPGTVGMGVVHWDGVAWKLLEGIYARHRPTHWRHLPAPPDVPDAGDSHEPRE